MHEITLN